MSILYVFSASVLLCFVWYLAWKIYYWLNLSTIKGPFPYPIFGSLHLLRNYPNPFECFTLLSKTYGDIYAIRLGSVSCVVVNNLSMIKEVLIKKGNLFGGRPDFTRYHKLFGGDRNNSLAFCDLSPLQKTRRHIARSYCSPRYTSHNYQLLNDVSNSEINFLEEELSLVFDQGKDEQLINLKPLVLGACANMFTQYMCSRRFSYKCERFQKEVRYYDEIFWDINQGYAVDYLPWLYPFYIRHMSKLSNWSGSIRNFILEYIVNDHLKTIDYSETPRDLTDCLLYNLKEEKTMEWQHVLYELEDFIGGHSAVGNLIILALVCLIRHPHAKTKILDEICNVTKNLRGVTLNDKPNMIYTEAVIFETLRFTSSPIVPHVALENTNIDGHFIKKGTCVILNNNELNSSSDYWQSPESFMPERFIKNGIIVKPPHFFPFGTGKRTCIGRQLVQGFSFVFIARIMQHFDVSNSQHCKLKTNSACVALPPDAFSLLLKRRKTYL